MTLRGAAPPSWRWTLSEASASASAAARSSPRGAVSVSRSLPLTCTAKVTCSSTSSAGSMLGHSASATMLSPPSRAQHSSARCGAIGQHEPAHRVRPVLGENRLRVDRVAPGLGHLFNAAGSHRLPAGDLDPVVAVPADLVGAQPAAVPGAIGLVGYHALREQAAE